MKKIAISFTIAVLILTQVISIVSAAPTTAVNCGDTYTVQRGDYLLKIADYCGLSAASILSLNPEIKNANLLFTGQVLRLTGAAPASSTTTTTTTTTGTTTSSCGDTYIVQKGDFLSKIAGICGYTTASIISLNPQITNPNVIYPGQVIRLSGAVAVPSTSTTTTGTGGAATTWSGSAQITISRTRALVGDDITVSVSGFPKNTAIDYRVSKSGASPAAIYDGATDANGTASRIVEIPNAAVKGENWVIFVTTTDLAKPVSVTSRTIFIGDGGTTTTTTSGGARVTLSSTSGQAGKQITVYVTGFPKNANVDYRLGKVGDSPAVIYDGVMDSTGSDDKIVTLPATAAKGETWVVVVTTTDLVKGTMVSSPQIKIDN